MNDMIKAVRNYELWVYLGWIDVAQRYKRSKIGPFWLTINHAVITVVLSLVWANIFKTEVSKFLPYFALSNVLWVFVSACISESSSIIVSSENILKQIQIPISTLILRLLAKNIFIFMHLIPIPLLVFLCYPSGWATSVSSLLLALLGLAVTCSFLVFTCILLGVICVRFRDIIPLISSALQMIFLGTPILWKKELLTGREYLYEWNIFFHLIEVVRLPLIDNKFPLNSLIFTLIATVLMASIWSFIHNKYKNRIVYWL